MNMKLLSRVLVAVTAGAVLAACVTEPAPRRVVATRAPVAPPPNPTKVYFYPLQNQSEEQQERDRYDCYNWSVRQTGFDPGKHLAPGEERATVVPARSPGQTIGAAAAVGAVIGAIASSPGNGAKGAAVGAIAGTVVGSAAAASEQQQAEQVQYRRNYRGDRRYEQQAAEYRRAMSACLEGRGYSVK